MKRHLIALARPGGPRLDDGPAGLAVPDHPDPSAGRTVAAGDERRHRPTMTTRSTWPRARPRRSASSKGRARSPISGSSRRPRTSAIPAPSSCGSTGTGRPPRRSRSRSATSSPPGTGCGPRSTRFRSRSAPSAAATTATGRCRSRSRPGSRSRTSPTRPRPGLYYQIDWVKLTQAPPAVMYFHARYHQEYPGRDGQALHGLRRQGPGPLRRDRHLLPERDRPLVRRRATTISTSTARRRPRCIGTGTEDYINEAWNMRVHTGLYTGCTIFEPRAPDARVTAYRWHIQDPVLFSKSLKFTIERRGYVMNAKGEVVAESGSRPDNWSSVVLLVPGHDRRAVVPLPALQGPGQSRRSSSICPRSSRP